MANLLDQISQGIVRTDTPILHQLKKLHPENFSPTLNLDTPDLIISLHQQSIQSGAHVIRTHSAHANRFSIPPTSEGSRINEINWKAARLAKEAAKKTETVIAGSVSPLPPHAPTETQIRRTAYQEQLGALLDGGSDVVFLEHFFDIDDLLLAIAVFQYLDNCPLIVSVDLKNNPNQAQYFFSTLKKAGADLFAIGGHTDAESAIKAVSSLETTPHDLIGYLPDFPIDPSIDNNFWLKNNIRLIGG